jgi:PAS domain S-box-containing protein
MASEPIPPDPERELRRARSLLSDLDAVAWEADTRTLRFTFVSQGVTDLLGYTPAEWLAAPTFWADRIHPDDRERVTAQFVRAALSGWSFDTEYRLLAGDGGYRTVRDLGHAVKDADGRPTLLRGLIVDVTRQRGLEEERREADERFRHVVERLTAIVYLEGVGSDGDVGPMLYISPRIEAVLGVSPAAWMSAPWLERVHPDDRQRVMDAHAWGAGRSDAVSLELRLIGPDGRVVHVRDEAVVVRAEDGEPRYRQGILEDVTQARVSEERARDSEARYGALVDRIPAIVYSIGLDDAGEAYVNPAVETLLGIEPGAWIADPAASWRDAVHVSDRDRVVADRAEADRRAAPLEADYRMVAVDGRVRWVHDASIVVPGRRGRPAVRHGVITDVSALKDAQARADDADARARDLVEQIPAITYREDPSGRVRYVSPQTSAILGYTPEEWDDDLDLRARIVDPADAGLLPDPEDDAEVRDATYRVQTRDGRSLYVHDVARIVRDADGTPAGRQGVMLDVTERYLARSLARDLEIERRAAERLRSLDDMKNTFLQAVSHDLRTPLAAILGLAITMGRDDVTFDPDETRELARRIAQNARRLDRLVTDLLDLDRITRGDVELVFRPTDVGTLVRDVVAATEVLEGRDVAVDTEPVIIPVDVPKLERIVENLIGNAAKHTPPDARVWIRVRAWEDGALLTVEDDGPGVPPQERDRIFEAFQQAGSESAAYAPGMGVGLSLVARFAELHDGGAWVEERPGGGASFRVFLPGHPGGYGTTASEGDGASDASQA